MEIHLHDPRFADGEPHEVAIKAGEQVRVALEATQTALGNFRWAARGAWLSAEDHRTGEMPKGDEFDSTAAARKLDDLNLRLEDLKGIQEALTKSAGWNPKSL